MVIAHQHQNIVGSNSYGLGCEFFARDQVELVEFLVNALARVSHSFGDREDAEKEDGKGHAGHGRHLLGEEVREGDTDKYQGDEAKSDGEFTPRNAQIEGDAVLARASVFVTQHQNRQTFHDEAPNDAKGIGFAQEVDVATAQDDGENLEAYHHIDNAIGCAKTGVRAAEPGR